MILLNLLVLEKESVESVKEVTEKPLNPEELKALPAFTLYTVQPRDTLWDIARGCRSTGAHICEMNDCTPEEIRPGRKLILVKELG